MITVKLLGGAKKSFSTDKIVLEKNITTINELISHLMQIKPKDTLEFDTKNLLIAVNGVDSSALQGYDTKLSDNDEISIIPIIHGGSSRRIQFSVAQSNVEIFDILFDKKFHRDFLSKSMSNISTFDCATENWILREEPPCMIGMILISSLSLSFVS